MACSGTPLVRDEPLGVPAFVKLTYCELLSLSVEVIRNTFSGKITPTKSPHFVWLCSLYREKSVTYIPRKARYSKADPEDVCYVFGYKSILMGDRFYGRSCHGLWVLPVLNRDIIELVGATVDVFSNKRFVQSTEVLWLGVMCRSCIYLFILYVSICSSIYFGVLNWWAWDVECTCMAVPVHAMTKGQKSTPFLITEKSS